MKKLFNRKYLSQYLIVLFLVGTVFSSVCFAQEQAASTKKLFLWLNELVSVLSWIWIVLANLAGKFMTNSVIYGSFLHLDEFFITWWSLMKDIANFALVFFLFYKVVVVLVKQDIVGMKKVIKEVLIAGILIQASWFVVGAVLDVSTVLTTAIGTLPAQVISSLPTTEKDTSKVFGQILKEKVQYNIFWKETTIKWISKKNIDRVAMTDTERKGIIDSLLPTYNSLSWPLIFLWIGVLKLQNMTYHEDSLGTFSDQLVNLALNALVLVFFSISLLFLFIFNFLRVFTLWVIIPLSPMLIILKIFNVDSLWSFIDIKKILKLIFMPVVLVAYLGTILLFVVSVRSILMTDQTEFYDDQTNLRISTIAKGNQQYDSGISVDGVFSLNMYNVKNTFADMFLYFLTFFLLWKMVMMMFQTKTGFSMIDKTMTWITDFSSSIVGNIWVIPIPGKGVVGMNAAGRMRDNFKDSWIASVNQTQIAPSNALWWIFWVQTPEQSIENQLGSSDPSALLKWAELQTYVKQKISTNQLSSNHSIVKNPYAMQYLEKYWWLNTGWMSAADMKRWLSSSKSNTSIPNTSGITVKKAVEMLWYDSTTWLWNWWSSTRTQSWNSRENPSSKPSSQG